MYFDIKSEMSMCLDKCPLLERLVTVPDFSKHDDLGSLAKTPMMKVKSNLDVQMDTSKKCAKEINVRRLYVCANLKVTSCPPPSIRFLQR